MRDPARIDRIISQLKLLWGAMPDVRFGQLLVLNKLDPGGHSALFYREDDETERLIKEGLLKYPESTYVYPPKIDYSHDPVKPIGEKWLKNPNYLPTDLIKRELDRREEAKKDEQIKRERYDRTTILHKLKEVYNKDDAFAADCINKLADRPTTTEFEDLPQC